MQASHSHIVEPFDRVAEELGAHRGLLCHRDIRSAGTDDHDSTMSTRYRLCAQQQADTRIRPIVKLAELALNRAGLGSVEPRNHQVNSGGGHPLRDFHDLLDALPCAENNLGDVAAQASMVIDTREAEILKRQITQALQRL